jgi:hypothetical protein
MWNHLARAFKMNNETWGRHANPWSVYTRYLTLPAYAAVIYYRALMGSFFWICIAGLTIWLWVNPRAFPKPQTTKSWASRAVLGERILVDQSAARIPNHHKIWARRLTIIGGLAMIPLTYGLVNMNLFWTLGGMILVNIVKTWFLDRMVWLYQDMIDQDPKYQHWLY